MSVIGWFTNVRDRSASSAIESFAKAWCSPPLLADELLQLICFNCELRNGALAEAIRTWKSNFDKEFEGIDECPICYSIIHTANNSLPRLACKTCKHKFHAACLYKWLSTSQINMPTLPVAVLIQLKEKQG